MENTKTLSLLEGPIIPSLLRFSVPILIALILQTAYGTVDMAVVGYFGDTASVSAVGTGGAIMTAITTVISCFATGVSVTVGQFVGRNDRQAAGRAVGAAIVMFAVFAAVLSIVMVGFSEQIAVLMKAPEEAFDKTVDYIRICSAGILFILAYNAISSVVRAMGDSRMPMIFVAIACVANAIGDLILVGLFDMDAAGAAIATVGAQALSVILSLIMLKKRKDLPIEFGLKYIRFWKEETLMILKVGFPLAVQSALAKCSFLMINAWINDMGLLKAASYSVSEKMISIVMLIPTAQMNSLSSFVAQNVGARQHKRAKEALVNGMLLGCAVGLAMFLLAFFGSDVVGRLFESDPAVLEQVDLYMKGFAADCILGCIHFALIGYMNGYGKTVATMIQGVTSAFLIRVPFSWWAAKETGSLFVMGLATPIGTVYGIIFGIAAIFYYRRIARKAGPLIE